MENPQDKKGHKTTGTSLHPVSCGMGIAGIASVRLAVGIFESAEQSRTAEQNIIDG